MKLKSFNIHRHESNPKEKELHDKFYKLIVLNSQKGRSNGSIDSLVFANKVNGGPKEHLTDREIRVMMSTVQWLGSHVGECFLRDCGFTLTHSGKQPKKLKPFEEFKYDTLHNIEYLYKKFEEGDCDPDSSETRMLNQCLTDIDNVGKRIRKIYDKHN